MTKKVLFGSMVAWLAAGIGASPSGAAPFNGGDHVACYKLHDTAKKQGYTATVGSNTLGAQDGCAIKTPAALFCIGSVKEDLSPPPFPATMGPNIQDQAYLCYKLKCSNGSIPLTVNDQFAGTRGITVTKSKMLCAPAQVL